MNVGCGDKATPFWSFAVAINCCVPFRLRPALAGETAMLVRIGFAVTVRLMVAVWLTVPLVPVTVIVDVPVAAVAPTVSVRVLVAVPVMDAGAKAAVTPIGRPEAASVTLPLKPPVLVRLITEVLLDPWAMFRLAGLADTLKSAEAVTVAVAVPLTVPLVARTVALPAAPAV